MHHLPDYTWSLTKRTTKTIKETHFHISWSYRKKSNILNLAFTRYGKLEFHLWHFDGEETKSAILLKYGTKTQKISCKSHEHIMIFK